LREREKERGGGYDNEREKGVEKGRGDKSNISHFILQNTD